MRNKLKAAIVVDVIALIASFAASALYFNAGPGKTRPSFELILVVALLLLAALLLVLFQSRSASREEMVRRFYLGSDGIYNHEIGYAPLSRIAPELDAYQLVTFAAESLAKMSYGFEVAQAPDDFEPRFVVSSKSFAFHFIGDEEDPADASVVIDQWSGSLQRVEGSGSSRTFTDVGGFANAKDLARMLEATESFELV